MTCTESQRERKILEGRGPACRAHRVPQLMTSVLTCSRHSLFVEGKTDRAQGPLYHGHSVDISESIISRMTTICQALFHSSILLDELLSFARYPAGQ